MQRPVNRAVVGVDAVHTLDGVFLLSRRLQRVDDVDALDDEHLVLDFHFTRNFGGELFVAGIDLARLQRASKGAGESAARCGDDVVKRGCVRLGNLGRNAIVRCNCPVHTKPHRLRFSRQIGLPQRALFALDSDF